MMASLQLPVPLWANVLLFVLIASSQVEATCHRCRGRDPGPASRPQLLVWAGSQSGHTSSRVLLQAASTTAAPAATPVNVTVVEWANGTDPLSPGYTAPNNTAQPGNRPLAVKDRPNLLDDFNRYHGGWDPTSEDYWGSVAFTALPAFIIGLLWILVGVVFIAVFLCTCGRREARPERRGGWLWLWGAMFVLALVATAGTTMSLVAASKTYSLGKDLEDVLLQELDKVLADAQRVLNVVTNATDALQRLDSSLVVNIVQGIAGLPQDTAFIEKAANKTAEWQQLMDTTEAAVNTNVDRLDRWFKGIYVSFIILGLLVYLFLIAQLVVGFFLRGRLLVLLAAALWLLSLVQMGYWTVSMFSFHVAADACQAFQEYVDNPVNASIGSILECQDPNAASEVQGLVQQGGDLLTQRINDQLSAVNTQLPAGFQVTQPCDPFPFIRKVPGLKQGCQAIDTAVNKTSAAYENAYNNYASISSGFNVVPQSMRLDLVIVANLVNSDSALTNYVTCKYVYDVLTVFLNDYCSPLKSNLELLWVGTLLTCVQALMTIGWVVLYYSFDTRPKGKSASPVYKATAAQLKEDVVEEGAGGEAVVDGRH